MARKRKPGRRVYYKTFSHARLKSQFLDARAMKKQGYARARVLSDANIAAREIRENRSRDAVLKLLGLKHIPDQAIPLPTQEYGDPRMEVEAQLDHMNRLADYDRHIILHTGWRYVRILFSNKEETQFWIVERDLITGKLRRSMIYGSREQAMMQHDSNVVRFVIQELPE